MATSLNGTTPQATYQSLLKLGDNSALSASLKRISDGAGNDTPIEISTAAVQFGGSTGMYWDNTNRRLGIGTNAPTTSLQVSTFKSTSINDNGTTVNFAPSYNTYTNGKLAVGIGDGVGRLTVRGSGATSATTALRVENSAGTSALTVTDAGVVNVGLSTGINWTFSSNTLTSSQFAFIVSNNGSILSTGALSGGVFGNNNGGKVADSAINTAQVASAVLEVASTTRGFLPPRMTTTQKNAIATPAAGLVVYDTDTNKLCCYNGTTWNDLF